MDEWVGLSGAAALVAHGLLTVCPAGHVDVLILAHRHRGRGAVNVEDVGRHHHLQVAHLADHGVRVHLAHVVTPVVLLRLADVQEPRIGVVVGDAVPWDARYHVLVDGQDHLSVYVDPGDLPDGKGSLSSAVLVA